MLRHPLDTPRHTDEECARLLDRFLLPPAELLAVLAPEGWSNSPLIEPDPRSVEPESQVVELVARVLWDVFSDNHTVFDADGRFDLGSFRASAGFLAEEINVRYRQIGRRRDYLDIYMGTIWLNHRADLGPVYRWVFVGLRAAGCDWRYSFPRISLVSFEHEASTDALSYDPTAAVVAELEAADRERERAAMQRRLDAGYNEAVEEAKRRPPPAIVQAYYDIYGGWPRGWPPSRTDE